MKISNIYEITKKELKSNFDNISGYLLTGIFLAVIYFLFLRTFFLVGSASVRGIFGLLPWIFAVYIPAVTMGSLAKERDKQTIENLITKPISTTELILGKVFGSASFVTFSLLLTLTLVPFIMSIGNLDLGETFASYFGAILMVFALTSIGVMISSFFSNQIVAFLTTSVAIVFLNLMSSQFISINIPLNIANTLSRLSIYDHALSLSRGVIELSDVAYFALITLVAILVAFLNVERYRVPSLKIYLKKVVIIGVVCLILTAILIFSYRASGIRLDLTKAQKYTLSQTTKEILNKEGKVKIDIYLSKELPTQFKAVEDEVKNILNDYSKFGGGQLVIEYKDPDQNEEKLNELRIPPTQFNVVGKDTFEIKQGYMVMVIYKEDDETNYEVVDLSGNIENYEYEITSLISKFKDIEKPKVAFVSGNGEKSLYNEYTTLNRILENDFIVEPVILPTTPTEEEATENTAETTETQEIPDLSQYKLVYIADPDNVYTDEVKNAIYSYVDNGGNVIYLATPIGVDIQTFQVTPDNNKGKLFEKYGVVVNTDLVYDVQSNIPVNVTIPDTMQTLLIPYPFFVRAPKSAEIIPNSPKVISLPWPSSLNISGESWAKLYTTTQYGGTQSSDAINLNPQQEFSNELSIKDIAAYLDQSDAGDIVVIGSAELFDDRFANSSQENLLLGLTLTEFLTQAQGLSSIKVKNIFDTQFLTVSDTQKNSVKYIAPAISYSILLLLGALRYLRKRRYAKRYA